MAKPLVSVLMPVFNAQTYLKEAIESILNQSFKDYEFLIINDGSVDKSGTIIEKFNKLDPRIRVMHHLHNKGLIDSLNEGIDNAEGAFIARMDADDISFPSRIEKQVKHMQSKNIDICGTWIRIQSDKFNIINKYPTNNDQIKARLLFKSAFAHPSVIIRKSLLDKYNLRYDPNNDYCEDYDLWTRASKWARMSNIPQPLLQYRQHSNQITKLHREEQIKKTMEVSYRTIQQNGVNLNQNDKKILEKLIINNISIDSLNGVENLFLKILKGNLNTKAFKLELQSKWLHICLNCKEYNLSLLSEFYNSKLSSGIFINPRAIFTLYLKCIFHTH